MVVIRHRHKAKYLDALHATDIAVGATPCLGAYARLSDIKPFLRYFKTMIAEELKYNIGFATEQSPRVWWFDGQRIHFHSNSSAIMLQAMQEQPDITIEQLAQRAGIVTAAVKKQLRQMTDKGYIQRREQGGDWLVSASPSV